MTAKAPTTLLPLSTPATGAAVRADQAATGAYVPPSQRVKLFSPSDWEQFVQEWAHSLKTTYHSVWRCGGAGDMGRDVIAHVGDPSLGGEWENFQCKHYDHALMPSDIWLELGKLTHYTHIGEYSSPRRYYFVSPFDVGITVAKLFLKPDRLRSELLKNWDKDCRDKIGVTPVPLTPELKLHIEKYPFDTIGFKPVLRVIEQHSQTPWHVHRFGGGLPNRPSAVLPPSQPSASELQYLRQLLLAYGNHKKCDLADSSQLTPWPFLSAHYQLSRRSFYSAESLLEFSRDHLPEGEYERLQDELFDGVQESYLVPHTDGYAKVLETTKAALQVQITDHALTTVLQPADRRGICHQLVNSQRLQWVTDVNSTPDKKDA
jgi:hypothetical protein